MCTATGEVVGLRKVPYFQYTAPYLRDGETYVPVIIDMKRQKRACLRLSINVHTHRGDVK